MTTKRIAILTRAPTYTGERTPIALNVEGTEIPWSEAAATVEWDGNGRLTYAGQLYLWERNLGERKVGCNGAYEFGDLYRLPVGWQCLISTALDGSNLAPAFKWPYNSRQKAGGVARQVITDNLALYATHLVARLVYQDGETYGEPVAELDGRNHTQGEAIQAIMAGKWLAWDSENDEAEDADTPPAPGPETNPTDSESQADSTTDAPKAQAALVVQYDAGSSGAYLQPCGSDTGRQGTLIGFKVNGKTQPAPAHSVFECRMWLAENDYHPDYPRWQWLDRGNGTRRRSEVYVKDGAAPVGDSLDYLKRYEAQQVDRPLVIPAEMRMSQEQIAAMNAATNWHDPTRPDPWYRQNGNPANVMTRGNRGAYSR